MGIISVSIGCSLAKTVVMVSWSSLSCCIWLTFIETDINVPLIVRGPGIGKNQTLDAITSHTDLAPTFLNIAGVTRDGLDGKKIPTTIAASTADNRTEHVAIEYWGLVSDSIKSA